jgi:hypothetical protein
VAAGLRDYFNKKVPTSDNYHLSLDSSRKGVAKDALVSIVGEHINSDKYCEAYEILTVDVSWYRGGGLAPGGGFTAPGRDLF